MLGSFNFGPESEQFVQVKDALFANPLAGAIMRAAGNIPVDRKNKNNQSLFAGSFEGESSYTLFSRLLTLLLSWPG